MRESPKEGAAGGITFCFGDTGDERSRPYIQTTLKPELRRSDSLFVDPRTPIAAGAPEETVRRLAPFDPFLDGHPTDLYIDDPQEISELMKVASAGSDVAFTFPALPEIFTGRVMTRAGTRPSGPPMVLVNVAQVELDTTAWAKNIAVNLTFFDGPDLVGMRATFAGSVGPIMALVIPPRLIRQCKPTRERAAVPQGLPLKAALELPGEGLLKFSVKEIGAMGLRGTLEPGPLPVVGQRISRVSLGLRGQAVSLSGVLSRVRVQTDQSRDILLDLDRPPPQVSQALKGIIESLSLTKPPRPLPQEQV